LNTDCSEVHFAQTRATLIGLLRALSHISDLNQYYICDGRTQTIQLYVKWETENSHSTSYNVRQVSCVYTIKSVGYFLIFCCFLCIFRTEESIWKH